MTAQPSVFTEFWGPSAWRLIHSIAYSTPLDDLEGEERERTEQAIKGFFGSLTSLLPCPSCRDHFASYLKQHPVPVDSREALVDWTYRLHDDVNRRRGKKSRPSRDAVDDIYQGWSHNPSTSKSYAAFNRLKTHADREAFMADPHNKMDHIATNYSSLDASSSSDASSWALSDKLEIAINVIILVLLLLILARFLVRRNEMS